MKDLFTSDSRWFAFEKELFSAIEGDGKSPLVMRERLKYQNTGTIDHL